MKLIVQNLHRYKLLLLLNVVAVVGFVVTELGIPTVMSYMIDQGVRNSDKVFVVRFGLILVGIALFGGASGVLLNYCSVRIATNITRDIRNRLFQKVQGMSHTDMNQFGVSSMISRTTSDPWQLQLFIQMVLRIAFLTPAMIIVSSFLIIRTSTSLAKLSLISVPVIIIGVVIIAKLSSPLSNRQQSLLDRLNKIIRENIIGVRVIRAFRKDRQENQRFEAVDEDYRKTSEKLFKLMSTTDPVFFFFLNCLMAVITLSAAHMINQQTLEVGQLVAFVEYQFHAMFSMMMFSMVFIMYPRASISAKRIQEVLDVKSSITEQEDYLPLPDAASATLAFNQVSFHYPDGENDVLKDVSFHVAANQTIAFIGSTGSGKSTVAKLIVRFFDPTQGSVELNGVDIRNLDIHDLRNAVGYTPQKALLFNGSIKDNIKFGVSDASDDKVIWAAKVAQAHEFISEKPGGYDEPVSEGGTNLSGGQKQRISIARALIKDAPILLFDDSFSALDYKTDATVRQNIREQIHDKVIIIVAQRVASIVNADIIVVLHEGEIVGFGQHQELMKTCAIYQEIAKSQLSEEELSVYENN